MSFKKPPFSIFENSPSRSRQTPLSRAVASRFYQKGGKNLLYKRKIALRDACKSKTDKASFNIKVVQWESHRYVQGCHEVLKQA